MLGVPNLKFTLDLQHHDSDLAQMFTKYTQFIVLKCNLHRIIPQYSRPETDTIEPFFFFFFSEITDNFCLHFTSTFLGFLEKRQQAKKKKIIIKENLLVTKDDLIFPLLKPDGYVSIFLMV